MSLSLRFAARSDVGLLRVDRKNQDSVYAGPRLIAVADGVGGQAAGDVASRTVIQSLMHLDEDAPGSDLVDVLRSATRHANAELKARIEQDPTLQSMGTTLTAILFGGSRLGLVHVGDSRGYLFRDDELSQITTDHTFVQSLVAEGRISAEEATVHPQRNVILKALSGTAVEPDYSVREAVAGDRYLLCSDGLSNVVSAESIAEALGTGDPDTACERLIQLALRGGGPDNITVVVADIIEGHTGDSEPVVAGAAAEGRGGTASVRADSAAARAALAGRTSADDPDEDAEPVEEAGHRTHRLRWTLVGLGVIVVLAAIGFAGWRYVQSQYYVGYDDDGTVSVLRGVSGSVGGLSLHSVADSSDLNRDDLQPVARNRVKEGISASSRSDARRIISELHEQLLPPCPQLPATATATPTPSATVSPTAAPSVSARTPTTPSVTPSAAPSPQPQTGRDCRGPHK